MSASAYHQPVLLEETLSALRIKPDEIYVDTTFGGGGHSRAILKKLSSRGKLVVFDQDEDAWKNVMKDERVILVPENFRHLKPFLKLYNAIPVAGILADLGISSYQIDQPERGFSTRHDAELDMRMDKRQSFTAADIIKHYDEEQLWRLFEKYGELRNARSLAMQIVQARKTFPLKTIDELKKVLTPVIVGNEQRYLAQVFQALRIEVNDELTALKEMLKQTVDVLQPGGRLAMITFHSLEDRIVKNFIKKGRFEDEVINPLAEEQQQHFLKPVYKKPVTPSAEEIKQNPRARSAKLRVAERVT